LNFIYFVAFMKSIFFLSFIYDLAFCCNFICPPRSVCLMVLEMIYSRNDL